MKDEFHLSAVYQSINYINMIKSRAKWMNREGAGILSKAE